MSLSLIFAVLALTAWFWRRNFRDSSLWMLATYAGLGIMVFQDYNAAGTFSRAIPRITQDFILIGMVGLVQSLAVAKRISVGTAVILTFALFVAAHFIGEIRWPDPAPPPPPRYDTASGAAAGAMGTDIKSNGGLDDHAEFLVELKTTADADRLRADLAGTGWTVTPAFFPKETATTQLDEYVTLDVDDVAAAEKRLQSLDYVVYLESNEVIDVEPFIAPNSRTGNTLETGYNLSINDPGTDQQWAMQVLEMDRYYRLLNRQRPQRQARIAILDTGIDAQHEDLDDNYFSIDPRYDVDKQSHGTHCAGIAAGVTNNGKGIGSLAGPGDSPFVEITSIKVLNDSGMGTQKGIISGILEAADEGVDVISLSLGGPSNGSRQKAYSAAVQYAIEQGCIVIAAAGNSNADSRNYSPANADGIIAVAAVDELLLRAPFSNRVGGIKRGIAAPGVGIYSTVPGDEYRAYSGTSMACPFVAGLLGVMKSIDPNLDAATAYGILTDTGLSGVEVSETGKIVQPYDALNAVLSR